MLLIGILCSNIVYAVCTLYNCDVEDCAVNTDCAIGSRCQIDFSKCEELDNEYNRNKCCDNIYQSKVIESSDIGICNSISDELLKEDCKMNVGS